MTLLEKLDNITEISTSIGNVNYDPYMRGMANGLLLAQHIMHDRSGNVPYFNSDGSRASNS